MARHEVAFPALPLAEDITGGAYLQHIAEVLSAEPDTSKDALYIAAQRKADVASATMESALSDDTPMPDRKTIFDSAERLLEAALDDPYLTGGRRVGAALLYAYLSEFESRGVSMQALRPATYETLEDLYAIGAEVLRARIHIRDAHVNGIDVGHDLCFPELSTKLSFGREVVVLGALAAHGVVAFPASWREHYPNASVVQPDAHHLYVYNEQAPDEGSAKVAIRIGRTSGKGAASSPDVHKITWDNLMALANNKEFPLIRESRIDFNDLDDVDATVMYLLRAMNRQNDEDLSNLVTFGGVILRKVDQLAKVKALRRRS